jgi:hypothetical protein
VHELANGGEDGGNGFIVGGELFIEPGLELSESAGQFLVRSEHLAQLHEGAPNDLKIPSGTKVLTATLATLNLANPVSDLNANLKRNERRFIGINGYACEAPGVSGEDKPLVWWPATSQGASNDATPIRSLQQ